MFHRKNSDVSILTKNLQSKVSFSFNKIFTHVDSNWILLGSDYKLTVLKKVSQLCSK